MRNFILVCVVLAACGGKKDDCERFYAKIEPLADKIGKRPPKAGDKDKFLAMCRSNPDKMKSDPMVKCVLDASGDDAVMKCMSGAFDDYRSKAKLTEAMLQLNKIAKNSKVYYNTNAKFVTGKSKTLPEKPCCEAGNPGGKCSVSTDWSKDPVWTELDFQIDEPNLFQYTYESKSDNEAVVTAVGDLDCDGTPITYTLNLTAKDGNPSYQITEPPANAD